MKRTAKKPVKKQPKRVKKCTMHGGVSAKTHYELNPHVNPTYPNPHFDRIHRYMELIGPYLIH